MEITHSYNYKAKRCAVVTGSNKGIGLEICRQLASNGIMVVLTARDEKKGVEALEDLKRSGLLDVVFHQLDVKDPASVASLASFVETHLGKLDILVNNSGVLGVTCTDTEAIGEYLESSVNGDWSDFREMDEHDKELMKKLEQTHENAEDVLKTNYYGTKLVTEALLPLLHLSKSARIVNVSSILGQLNLIYNKKVRAELDNIDCLTEERLDELLQMFLNDFKENKLKANGWPITASAYKLSKMAINAYTRILAKKFPTLQINCVHPGYVKTDITGNNGRITAEEGARGPVMLALLADDNGRSGLYFDEMEASTF